MSVADERYFIQRGGDTNWTEVDIDGFVDAERAAGFRPKPGCGPLATAGFSGPSGQRGTITSNGDVPVTGSTLQLDGTTTTKGKGPKPSRFGLPPRPGSRSTPTWTIQNLTYPLDDITSFDVGLDHEGEIEIEINSESREDVNGGHSVHLTEAMLHAITVKVLEAKTAQEVRAR